MLHYYYQDHQLDILCLQETKMSDAQIKTEISDDILPGYKSYWACSNVKKGYAGTVSILCVISNLSN